MKNNSVEKFLDVYFAESSKIEETVLKSIRYSLLQKAAKRFRAQLCLLTAEALGCPADTAMPYAAALECVHAYSLIHDDLPCMDNDDFRRGEPTNHKVFGEATALLAGDALITEAFSILTESYKGNAELALKLISTLSEASGMRGMISGQSRDLQSATVPLKKIEELEIVHRQKTGALISAAIIGAAYIGKADDSQLQALKQFGQNLGLAFQVKDDLLDYSEDMGASYTSFMGLEAAQKYLQMLTDSCLKDLAAWDQKADRLRELAKFNFSRAN